MHRLFIAVHRSAILLWYLLRIGSDGGWGNTTFFCQQNHYMESHHGMIAHNSNQNSEFIKKVNFKNEKCYYPKGDNLINIPRYNLSIFRTMNIKTESVCLEMFCILDGWMGYSSMSVRGVCHQHRVG